MELQLKKILFLTGTRADFGKMKPLIEKVEKSEKFEAHIFATGMHMLARYGSTINEIHKAGFKRVYSYINQDGSVNSQMDLVLANTTQGVGHYVRIATRSDSGSRHRIEALAGRLWGPEQRSGGSHRRGEISSPVDGSYGTPSASCPPALRFHDEARRLSSNGRDGSTDVVIGSRI
jgi:UDP-N-acetylglucosamine 2-epimerase (hydrolysing)